MDICTQRMCLLSLRRTLWCSVFRKWTVTVISDMNSTTVFCSKPISKDSQITKLEFIKQSKHSAHLCVNSVVVCVHNCTYPSAWWTGRWSVYTNCAYVPCDELNGGLSTQTVPTFCLMKSMVVCLHKLCLPSAWWSQRWSVYTNCA